MRIAFFNIMLPVIATRKAARADITLGTVQYGTISVHHNWVIFKNSNPYIITVLHFTNVG